MGTTTGAYGEDRGVKVAAPTYLGFDTVREALKDGEYHSATELHDKLHAFVPPDRAYKRALSEGPKYIPDTAAAVAWGKWRIVQYTLACFVQKGRIEGCGVGVDRKYRLKGIANGKDGTEG